MAITFDLASNAVVNESETASFEVSNIQGVPVSGCPFGQTFQEGGVGLSNPILKSAFFDTFESNLVEEVDGSIGYSDADSGFAKSWGVSQNGIAVFEITRTEVDLQVGRVGQSFIIKNGTSEIFRFDYGAVEFLGGQYLQRLPNGPKWVQPDGSFSSVVYRSLNWLNNGVKIKERVVVDFASSTVSLSGYIEDSNGLDRIDFQTTESATLNYVNGITIETPGSSGTVQGNMSSIYYQGQSLPNNCTGEVADATIEYYRNGVLDYTGNPLEFPATLAMNGDQIVARVSTDTEFAESAPVTLVVNGLQTGAKKISHTVKVYVGGTTEEPTIGLSSGVCSWGVDDQTLGILTENWVSGINLSVDMSVSGNYARYSDPKVSIVKSANVETVLNNIDLSLINSRIEIESTDGVNTVLLYRGVIKSTHESGNVVVLALSHLSNYYATQLSPTLGDEQIPIVWGNSVDGVKMPVVQPPESEDLTIGDNLIPAFVVVSQTDERITFRSAYDESLVSSDDMIDFLTNNRYFIAKGENTLIGRKFGEALVYNYVIGGKTYKGFKMYALPTNIKDDTGTPYLPNGSTVILERTDYTKYYTPYGSDISNATLQYKDGDVFYDFPEYVDSRVDYDDRIEILDADSSGDNYVIPYTVAQWDRGLWGGLADPFNAFVSNGIWTTPLGSVTNIVLSNEDKLADRFGVSTGSTISCRFNSSGPAILSFITQYPISFKGGTPDSLFFTASEKITASNVGTSTITNITTKVFISTVADTYDVYEDVNASIFGNLNSVEFFDNLYPTSVGNDSQNIKYRWDNDHIASSPMVLGRDIDLFGPIVNDYEKSAPMTVIQITNFSFQQPSTTNVDISIDRQMNLVKALSYNTDQIYINGVEGKKDNLSGTVIADTLQAYFSVLELQNYSSLGFAAPAEGWGLGFASSGILAAIGGFEGYYYEISKPITNTSSKDLKIKLLTLMTSIGFINNQGLEDSKRIERMYETGYIFNAFNIEEQPDINSLDPIKTFPLISVTHGSGTINISNIEQDIYSSDYVSGFVSASNAKEIWRGCKLVYDNYGIKNKLPDKMQDITYFPDDLVASSYIVNQLERMGVEIDGEVVTLKQRYTLKFKTDLTTFFKAVESDPLFWIGSSISFTYPNIASAHTGIITGLGFSPTTGNVNITAEMVGDLLATSDVATIIESGTQTDNIVESGTQTTNYVEEI